MPSGVTGEMVLMELLDAVIDRNADILERAGGDMDNITTTFLSPRAARNGHAKRYSDILIAIAARRSYPRCARVCLVAGVTFVAPHRGVKWSKDMREQLKTMQRDVVSLTDHASYPQKITFCWMRCSASSISSKTTSSSCFRDGGGIDAADLIASIYGMNFKIMPELEWQHGLSFRAGGCCSPPCCLICFFT